MLRALSGRGKGGGGGGGGGGWAKGLGLSPSKKETAAAAPEGAEEVRALMEENEALRRELAADREVRWVV